MLEIVNLSTSYAGWRALDKASLSVDAGEIVGLCGPNKAGKSTLCKCLAGTIAIDSGDIFFNGQRINESFVSQRLALGLSLCPERGTEENEATPIYLNESVEFNLDVLRGGLPYRDWAPRLKQALSYLPDEFDLRKRMKQLAHTLSGGECQILGIVRKLIPLLGPHGGARLLVVDEPLRGLAPVWSTHVFNTLKRVRDDAGVSVLLAEEMLGNLSAVDRIYILHRGEIAAEGKFDNLMSSAAIAEIFTGHITVPGI